MKKYLRNTINEFQHFIQGMTANPDAWLNQPVKLVDMTTVSTALTAIGNDIDTAEAAASETRQAGLNRNSSAVKLFDQAANLAYGIYATTPEKLIEYGLKPRKDPSKVPAPTKTLAIDIADDTDGEGFNLIITAKDDVADNYEWQKGQAADAKDVNIIPPLAFFKTSSKTKFLDDDVLKGIRYFYRVRALNRNGQGPWSEPVSRVQ